MRLPYTPLPILCCLIGLSCGLPAVEPPAAPPPVPLSSMLDLHIPGISEPQLVPGSSLRCGEVTTTVEPSEIITRDATPQGELACAKWVSADGTTSLQRTVVAIKPEYAVIIDHVYPPAGEHTVSRTFNFPAAPTISGTVAEGGGMRVYMYDSTQWSVTNTTLTVTSSISKPSAFMAVILPITKLQAAIAVEQIKAGNPLVRKLQIRYADKMQHDLGFAWERRTLHVNNIEYFARAVCVKTGGTMTQIITLP